ncbi:hypothetical protein G6022_05265, partial [Dietzia sp. Cai40]|nr:hypothetical protein [Dietzia sp. Cai40]
PDSASPSDTSAEESESAAATTEAAAPAAPGKGNSIPRSTKPGGYGLSLG